jgi:hypothetical protein
MITYIIHIYIYFSTTKIGILPHHFSMFTVTILMGPPIWVRLEMGSPLSMVILMGTMIVKQYRLGNMVTYLQ